MFSFMQPLGIVQTRHYVIACMETLRIKGIALDLAQAAFILKCVRQKQGNNVFVEYQIIGTKSIKKYSIVCDVVNVRAEFVTTLPRRTYLSPSGRVVLPTTPCGAISDSRTEYSACFQVEKLPRCSMQLVDLGKYTWRVQSRRHCSSAHIIWPEGSPAPSLPGDYILARRVKTAVTMSVAVWSRFMNHSVECVYDSFLYAMVNFQLENMHNVHIWGPKNGSPEAE